jgi:hypothetical protein
MKPKLSFLDRKGFRLAGIVETDLSPTQLLQLRQMQESAEVFKVPDVQFIAFSIKEGVQDLLQALRSRNELIGKNIDTKSLPSLQYIYGNEIGTQIYQKRSNTIRLGIHKTENFIASWINNSYIFKQYSIVYEHLTELQKQRLGHLFERYSFEELAEWKLPVANFVKYDLTNYAGRIKRLKKNHGRSMLESVLRYGKVEGVRRHTAKCQHTTAHFTNTRPYWLRKGLSVEEADLKISQIQQARSDISTKSLDQQKLIRLKRGHSIESYMARGMSEDEARAQLKRYHQTASSISKVSQKLFDMVAEIIGPDFLFYARLNYEKQIGSHRVDFYDSLSDTVVEFFGDYWHCNPTLYTNDSIVHKKPVLYRWQSDRQRIKALFNNVNVKAVHIIWEREFREDPRQVALTLANFLKDARNG